MVKFRFFKCNKSQFVVLVHNIGWCTYYSSEDQREKSIERQITEGDTFGSDLVSSISVASERSEVFLLSRKIHRMKTWLEEVSLNRIAA